jgi:hypothetical protein
MIVDLFIARRLDGSTHSAESLRLCLDANAPSPRALFLPSGELVHVFAIDCHVRSVVDVCTGLGYEYSHVVFIEMHGTYYSPGYALRFYMHNWARVFLMHWRT